MKVNKVTVRWLALAFALLLALFSGFFGCVKSAPLSPIKRFTLAIDAGHGGVDGGTEGCTTKVRESDVNLAIAQLLEKTAVLGGVRCVMTRKSQGGLYGVISPGYKKRDMRERVRIINQGGCDVAVSIHQNKFSDSGRRGSQIYYKKGDERGLTLAKYVAEQISKMEEAPRECTVLAGDYYVINEASCPAIIIECGFLSNREDEALLLDEDYRARLCAAIFYGINCYFAML